MDYGHALEFGAFITPSAADPQVPVLLSQAAEAAGLDLVTFQDHPYQPAFLDTWTLMSFIAARTERVRIAPNVLNIPLRPPVGRRPQRCQPRSALRTDGSTSLSEPGASGTPSRRWAAPG